MTYGFPKRSSFTPPFNISWKFVSLSIILLVSITLGLYSSLPAFAAPSAANPDGDLRIDPITAYNFVVDSNVLSPSTYGPESATLGAKFCNDGGNDLTDVYAYIGDFSGTPTPAALSVISHSCISNSPRAKFSTAIDPGWRIPRAISMAERCSRLIRRSIWK